MAADFDSRRCSSVFLLALQNLRCRVHNFRHRLGFGYAFLAFWSGLESGPRMKRRHWKFVLENLAMVEPMSSQRGRANKCWGAAKKSLYGWNGWGSR